jgi:hypothetical protein
VEQHDKSLVGATVIPARSQDTVNEFWPELDTYVTLSPTYRLFFVASKSVDQFAAVALAIWCELRHHAETHFANKVQDTESGTPSRKVSG